ncbi:glutamine-hydrolyzing carbamoyl-phosphate synthase small subunit [Legionella sp. W05-934-2]|jgi:carbamoyl-phosphate synthase small subunit|uniref:glutamine-hydrolyzing carbamoyl-phosphate synthase small subunit n=1 Tax=Legionella sp. W05-934-2 TaxID=1198649 RepID=UPI003463670D
MTQPTPAILALADGTICHGYAIGHEGTHIGELVFNTSMTGYQEMLTDPSYSEQIITLTAAHIGNTGCNEEDIESKKIWAKGLVIREYSPYPSSWRAQTTLSDWLHHNHVTAIAGVDTRFITRHLRDHGSQGACITTEYASQPDKAVQLAQSFSGLSNRDLAKEVSCKTEQRWDTDRGEWGPKSTPQNFHVIAYDYGAKHNILRILQELGCHVTIVPAKTPAEDVLRSNPDGIFLSNGPGDPAACDYAIKAVKQFISAKVPLFGICLGYQILALACGAKETKMKFGHHGGNHPVIDLQSNRVMITSQNHGFMIEETSLPNELIATHRSLFDQSLQGIKHTSAPAYGFQGHPEGGPGPHDAEKIFKPFISAMSEYKSTREL